MGGRTWRTAFVGRASELERLDAAHQALAEQGAATVLVVGEAGIGKSRLVEEFCDRARTNGALVATGVCTPAEGGGLPYGPVVGVLRDLRRQLTPFDAAELVEPVQQQLGLATSSWAERLDHTTMTLSPAVGMAKTSVFEAMLTPREVEVFAQLACGRTDRQIADELFISKKTASVHVSNLLRKLDVGSRVEAAEIGQRAGLGRDSA
jgi:DNA-binding CsgD family transcriptional regulator